MTGHSARVQCEELPPPHRPPVELVSPLVIDCCKNCSSDSLSMCSSAATLNLFASRRGRAYLLLCFFSYRIFGARLPISGYLEEASDDVHVALAASAFSCSQLCVTAADSDANSSTSRSHF